MERPRVAVCKEYIMPKKNKLPAKSNDKTAVTAPPLEPSKYHALAATHVFMGAPFQYMKNEEVR
jgi:hypothetical protein